SLSLALTLTLRSPTWSGLAILTAGVRRSIQRQYFGVATIGRTGTKHHQRRFTVFENISFAHATAATLLLLLTAGPPHETRARRERRQYARLLVSISIRTFRREAQRCVRNQQRILYIGGDDLGRRGHARPQQQLGIGDFQYRFISHDTGRRRARTRAR